VSNAIFSVNPDSDPVTITLTGTASPPAGAAGTNGTATGETCYNPAGTELCYPGAANVAILAPGSTAPPTSTITGAGDGPSTTVWLLPAALIALVGFAFTTVRRARSR
jgi:hypothetical protein